MYRAHERLSELEGSSAQPGEAREQDATPATTFTDHGPKPPVAAGGEHVSPAPPTASERAYGPAQQKGGAAPLGPDGVLLTTVRRVIDGVTVVAPPGAHADAIDKCASFIQQELGRNLHAQKKMAEARATIVIIPARTKMTDLPEFAKLQGTTTFDGRDWSAVRGSGGMNAPDGSFAIGVAEENLRTVPGVISTYAAGYSIGMHELAHAVESKGLTKTQKQRLDQLYAQHQAADPGDARDTFTDKYAASNVHEYFAQCTNAFFGKNEGKDKDRHAYHNGRDWLRAKDPNMYAFLVELYETNHDADGNRADRAS